MNKQTIITALLAFVTLAVYGQADSTKVKKKKEDRISMYGTVTDGFTSTTVKQDSIAIRTDSLCQRNVMCNHDTIRKDSCQQHRLSFVRKEQRPAWSISPNAEKKQKFDPYRKKFTDMRIMETIGSHISR